MTSSPTRACVADATAVSALGKSLESMWSRLCAGETAVDQVRRFATESIDYHDAACVGDLE